MSKAWLDVILVGAGGFAGAIARFVLSTVLGRAFPSAVPYGTLTVNVLGCLALGMIVGTGLAESWTLLLGTGFMGAFTTFSTLKLEGVKLLRTGDFRSVLIYYGFTYMLGLALVFAGYWAGSLL